MANIRGYETYFIAPGTWLMRARARSRLTEPDLYSLDALKRMILTTDGMVGDDRYLNLILMCEKDMTEEFADAAHDVTSPAAIFNDEPVYLHRLCSLLCFR